MKEIQDPRKLEKEKTKSNSKKDSFPNRKRNLLFEKKSNLVDNLAQFNKEVRQEATKTRLEIFLQENKALLRKDPFTEQIKSRLITRLKDLKLNEQQQEDLKQYAIHLHKKYIKLVNNENFIFEHAKEEHNALKNEKSALEAKYNNFKTKYKEFSEYKQKELLSINKMKEQQFKESSKQINKKILNIEEWIRGPYSKNLAILQENVIIHTNIIKSIESAFHSISPEQYNLSETQELNPPHDHYNKKFDQLGEDCQNAHENYQQAHQKCIQAENTFQKTHQSWKDIAKNDEESKAIWLPVLNLREQVLEARQRACTASEQEFSKKYQENSTSQTTIDAAKRMLDARRALLDSANTVLDAGQEAYCHTRSLYDTEKQVLIAWQEKLDASQYRLNTAQSILDYEQQWLDTWKQHTDSPNPQQNGDIPHEMREKSLSQMRSNLTKMQEYHNNNFKEFNEHSKSYEKSLLNLDDNDISHDITLQNNENKRRRNEQKRYLLTSGNQRILSTLLKLLFNEVQA